MKPAPTKYSVRNTTKNQNKGRFLTEQNEMRQEAIQLAEQAKEMPHLKEKPIKYDLKR
jgi:hypothetical protein